MNKGLKKMSNIRSRGGWNAHNSVNIEMSVGDCYNEVEPNPILKLIDKMPDAYGYLADSSFNLYQARTTRSGAFYNHIIQSSNPVNTNQAWTYERFALPRYGDE